MKRVFILALLTLAMLVGKASADIILKGKISLPDGKVPKRADVKVTSSYQYQKVYAIARCDPNGNYRLALSDSINAFTLRFGAVDCMPTSINAFSPGGDSLELNVRLCRLRLTGFPSLLEIEGNFNDFGKIGKPIGMKQTKDGKYEAAVSCKSDTLMYQFSLPHSDGKQRFNGSDDDFYLPDNDMNYVSCRIVKPGTVGLVFDPKLTRSEQSLPEFDSPDPRIREFLAVHDSLAIADKLTTEIMTKCSEKKMDTKGFEEAKSGLIRKAGDLFRSSKYDFAKMATAFSAIDYVAFGSSLLTDKSLKCDQIFEYFLRKFPCGSNAQSDYYFFFPYFYYEKGDTLLTKYRDEFIPCLDSDVVCGSLMAGLLFLTDIDRKDEALKYYREIQSKYPDSEEFEELNNQFDFDKQKKVKVGNQIPDFEVPDIDNDGMTINIRDFRGKYVLIDVWGTWCKPCVGEIPNLTKAYAKYKDKNFTILGLAVESDKTPVQKLRKKEGYSMPWRHGILSDTAGKKTYELLEIYSVPMPILIDPNGIILDMGQNLRGTNLENVLDHYL